MKKGRGRPDKYSNVLEKLDDTKIDFLSMIKKGHPKGYNTISSYICKFRLYELINSKKGDLKNKSKEELESLYKNDVPNLYEFKPEEIKTMLSKFKIGNINGINIYISVINQYKAHAYKLGKISRIDYVYFTDKEKSSLIYDNRFRNKFLTKEDLHSLCNSKLKNAQDKAVIMLPFYGTRGRDYEEMKNLKFNDLDIENCIIHLKNRYIKIDEKTMIYLIDAHKQEKYEKKDNKKSTEITLEDTCFVLKNIINSQRTDDKISSITIKSRLRHIAEIFDRPLLNVTDIYDSGKIYFLEIHMKRTGKTSLSEYTYDEIREILKQFGNQSNSQIVNLIRNHEKMMEYLSSDNQFLENVLLEDIDESFFYTDPQTKETETKEVIINQIIRDKPLVKEMKTLYDNTCQICGEPLTLIDEISYCEACHIQPLGKQHNGIDDKSNMMILCPNHHKLFDLGIISIDPSDLKTILHVDKKNSINNSMLKISKHNISKKHVMYHYKNIFMPLYKKLNLKVSKNKK